MAYRNGSAVLCDDAGGLMLPLLWLSRRPGTVALSFHGFVVFNLPAMDFPLEHLPREQLVVLMSRIAAILAQPAGPVVQQRPGR